MLMCMFVDVSRVQVGGPLVIIARHRLDRQSRPHPHRAAHLDAAAEVRHTAHSSLLLLSCGAPLVLLLALGMLLTRGSCRTRRRHRSLAQPNAPALHAISFLLFLFTWARHEQAAC